MRRPMDALGDLLVALAVMVWVVGGAFGAVQVLRYTYELLGVWWVMFAVLALPIAMAVMPFVALLHDNSWSLFLGTWDTLMLGWILQLAGGLISDRPRSGVSSEQLLLGRGYDEEDDAPAAGAAESPPDGADAADITGAPTSARRAGASAASDEGSSG